MGQAACKGCVERLQQAYCSADIRLTLPPLRRSWDRFDEDLSGLVPGQVLKVLRGALAEAALCLPDSHSLLLEALEQQLVTVLSERDPAQRIRWEDFAWCVSRLEELSAEEHVDVEEDGTRKPQRLVIKAYSLQIQLPYSGVFCGGTTLFGKLRLVLPRSRVVTAFTVTLVGDEELTMSNGFHGSRTLFEMTVDVSQGLGETLSSRILRDSRGWRLEEGPHDFDFEMDLPDTLPCTVDLQEEGEMLSCSLGYRLVAFVRFFTDPDKPLPSIRAERQVSLLQLCPLDQDMAFRLPPKVAQTPESCPVQAMAWVERLLFLPTEEINVRIECCEARALELRVARLSLVRILSLFGGETATRPMCSYEKVVGTRLFDATAEAAVHSARQAAGGGEGGTGTGTGTGEGSNNHHHHNKNSGSSSSSSSSSMSTFIGEDLFVQELTVTVPQMTIPTAEAGAFFSLRYVVRVTLLFADRSLNQVLELPVHLSHPVCCFHLKPPDMDYPVLPYQDIFHTDDIPPFAPVAGLPGVVPAPAPVAAPPVLYHTRPTLESLFPPGDRRRGGGPQPPGVDEEGGGLPDSSFEGLSLVGLGEEDTDNMPASVGMWLREDRLVERQRKKELFGRFQEQQRHIRFLSWLSDMDSAAGSMSNAFADCNVPRPSIEEPPADLVVGESVLIRQREGAEGAGDGADGALASTFSRHRTLGSLASLLGPSMGGGNQAWNSQGCRLLQPREIVEDFLFRKSDVRANWSVSVVADPWGGKDRDVYTNKVTGQRTYSVPMSLNQERKVPEGYLSSLDQLFVQLATTTILRDNTQAISNLFDAWSSFGHLGEVAQLGEIFLESLVTRGLVLESIEVSRDRNSGTGDFSLEDTDPRTGFLKASPFRVWHTRVGPRLPALERAHGAAELSDLFTSKLERVRRAVNKHVDDVVRALERRRGGGGGTTGNRKM